MTNVGTIIAGYGITIVTLGFYATWITMRGREIGTELGIGADSGDTDPSETDPNNAAGEKSPWT